MRSTPSIDLPRQAGFLRDFWSDEPHANRLKSFPTVDYGNSDALTLCQAGEPGTIQHRGVHEDVLAYR